LYPKNIFNAKKLVYANKLFYDKNFFNTKKLFDAKKLFYVKNIFYTILKKVSENSVQKSKIWSKWKLLNWVQNFGSKFASKKSKILSKTQNLRQKNQKICLKFGKIFFDFFDENFKFLIKKIAIYIPTIEVVNHAPIGGPPTNPSPSIRLT